MGRDNNPGYSMGRQQVACIKKRLTHHCVSSTFRLKQSKHFKSEVVTLQTPRMKMTSRKQNRNMKIKLINAAEGMQEDGEHAGISGITTNSGEGPPDLIFLILA